MTREELKTSLTENPDPMKPFRDLAHKWDVEQRSMDAEALICLAKDTVRYNDRRTSNGQLATRKQAEANTIGRLRTELERLLK